MSRVKRSLFTRHCVGTAEVHKHVICRIFDAGIRPVKLASCFGGKLGKHIAVRNVSRGAENQIRTHHSPPKGARHSLLNTKEHLICEGVTEPRYLCHVIETTSVDVWQSIGVAQECPENPRCFGRY